MGLAGHARHASALQFQLDYRTQVLLPVQLVHEVCYYRLLTHAPPLAVAAEQRILGHGTHRLLLVHALRIQLRGQRVPPQRHHGQSLRLLLVDLLRVVAGALQGQSAIEQFLLLFIIFANFPLQVFLVTARFGAGLAQIGSAVVGETFP